MNDSQPADQTPTPEQIDAWPSRRSVDESPTTSPNPSTGGDENDPEDGAIETPPR